MKKFKFLHGYRENIYFIPTEWEADSNISEKDLIDLIQNKEKKEKE